MRGTKFKGDVRGNFFLDIEGDEFLECTIRGGGGGRYDIEVLD